MRARNLFFSIPIALLVACSGNPEPQPAGEITNALPQPVRIESSDEAVVLVASSNSGEAKAAAAWLRSRGQPGLDALLEAYGDIRSYRLGEAARPAAYDPAVADRVLAAMNRVSGQFDGWASGLYWHTDRNLALHDAVLSDKPVLNLWLLGNLDDEFC